MEADPAEGPAAKVSAPPRVRTPKVKTPTVEAPRAAVRGARCVVTDAWVSMHQEGEDGATNRHNILAPYQVTPALMAAAGANWAAAPGAVEQADAQARAAEELVRLPVGSAIAEMLSDYAVLRDQTRVCGR